MTHSPTDPGLHATEPPAVLLVETHSPAASTGGEFIALARCLLDAGTVVQLHLMQDAVTWIQQDPKRLADLSATSGARLRITVDDVSLDLRGITRPQAAGIALVRSASDLVADMAAHNVKTLWHS